MGIRYYKTNVDGVNRLEFTSKLDGEELFSCKEIPLVILGELRTICSYCEKKDYKIVSIMENSELGKFIQEHDNLFLDYIDYSDVVNAFNISVFEDNVKMSNKLMHPFKDRFSGTKTDFLTKYCKKMLSYIEENHDFSAYLEHIDGKDTKFYYDGFVNVDSDDFYSCSSDLPKIYQKK